MNKKNKKNKKKKPPEGRREGGKEGRRDLSTVTLTIITNMGIVYSFWNFLWAGKSEFNGSNIQVLWSICEQDLQHFTL